jgi:hypothetical protein
MSASVLSLSSNGYTSFDVVRQTKPTFRSSGSETVYRNSAQIDVISQFAIGGKPIGCYNAFPGIQLDCLVLLVKLTR